MFFQNSLLLNFRAWRETTLQSAGETASLRDIRLSKARYNNWKSLPHETRELRFYFNPTSFKASLQRPLTFLSFFSRQFINRPSPAWDVAAQRFKIVPAFVDHITEGRHSPLQLCGGIV